MRLRISAGMIATLLCLLPGCAMRPIAARQVISSMGVEGGRLPLTAGLEVIREEENEIITVQGNNFTELFSAAEQQSGEPLYLGALQSIVFSGVPDGSTLQEYLRMLLADGRIAPNTQIALCQDVQALYGGGVTGDEITALLTRQYTDSCSNGLKELVNRLEGDGRDGLLVWLSAEEDQLREAGAVPTGSSDYTALWQPEDLFRLLLGQCSEIRFSLPVGEGEAAVLLRQLSVSGVAFEKECKEPRVTLLAEATVQAADGTCSRQQLAAALQQDLQQRLAAFNREMARSHSDLLGLRARARLSGIIPEEISFAEIRYDLRLVLRDPRGLLP